jgi:ribA/ribD-fused uncharacterized protein
MSESEMSLSKSVKYDKDEFVFFYGNGSHTPNACFSQWYSCSFVDPVLNVEFTSAEQYMMHEKALIFGDLEIADQILATNNVDMIKRLGRRVKNFDSALWDINKFKIVVNGNYLKFSQNFYIKRKMLSYGPPVVKFVEASKHDRIWGIGYDEATALQNRDNWGLNLLGKALSQVHERLYKESMVIY